MVMSDLPEAQAPEYVGIGSAHQELVRCRRAYEAQRIEYVEVVHALNAEHERAERLDAEVTALRTINQTLNENLSMVQQKSTELLLAYRQVCLQFPGWECKHCRAFNGEAKRKRDECWACEKARKS